MEKGSAGLDPEDGKLIGGAAITQTSGRNKAKRHDASQGFIFGISDGIKDERRRIICIFI